MWEFLSQNLRNKILSQNLRNKISVTDFFSRIWGMRETNTNSKLEFIGLPPTESSVSTYGPRGQNNYVKKKVTAIPDWLRVTAFTPLHASLPGIITMCLQTNGGGHVPFTVTAAGEVYKQTIKFVYLGGAISAGWDLRSVEIARRIQRAWACSGRYKMEICDRPSVRLRLKVRMLRAEVMETPLYGCVTWSPSKAAPTGYGRSTTRCSSDASSGGNESAKTTSCPMPTRFSGQNPRPLRRP